jgi:hypothetical protein
LRSLRYGDGDASAAWWRRMSAHVGTCAAGWLLSGLHAVSTLGHRWVSGEAAAELQPGWRSS